MRELPLNALRAFALAYETGGVRSAARVLQVTHSAVSRHLRELEAWLDVPLVSPDSPRRNLVLTPQGRELGSAASHTLRELEHAVRGVQERHHSTSVVLSTTPSLAARWLLPRLAAFEQAHPRIEISIVVEQRVIDPRDLGADLAVRMGSGSWDDPEREALMDDRLYPVMSASLWEQKGRPSSPDTLLGIRLLHDRDPSASWEAWRAAMGPATLDVRAGPRFASSDLVLRAAEEGLGMALARGRLAQAELHSGRLIRPFGDLEIVLPDAYWIVRAPGSPRKAAVGAVIKWLRHCAAKDGGGASGAA